MKGKSISVTKDEEGTFKEAIQQRGSQVDAVQQGKDRGRINAYQYRVHEGDDEGKALPPLHSRSFECQHSSINLSIAVKTIPPQIDVYSSEATTTRILL